MSQPSVLISAERIASRVRELAAEISADYADTEDIVLIGVLKGAFVFLADLARELTVAHTIEFIALSSYGSKSRSSGAVQLIMDVRGDIENRHVLIVEDIIDSGHTLKYLREILAARRPASIRTCTLLYKAERAEVDVHSDYIGFPVNDQWVVGYGLDYAERERMLPYIGVITPDDRS